MAEIRKRRNTRRYGWFRVTRLGYEWRRVSIHLPFFRELILWERARR